MIPYMSGHHDHVDHVEILPTIHFSPILCIEWELCLEHMHLQDQILHMRVSLQESSTHQIVPPLANTINSVSSLATLLTSDNSLSLDKDQDPPHILHDYTPIYLHPSVGNMSIYLIWLPLWYNSQFQHKEASTIQRVEPLLYTVHYPFKILNE